ncbi:hypothetical protein GCM10023321_77250 [Pseudonocardia eucalypti]|uniref:Uncharacterized protein n=1 Tax=Pseudonocardia eucalypti TaxID=648755 RepID=A0ABP9RAJ5_9PSEU|nr:hypothetical protein [Pseudonocardia eucalypti]
METQSSTPDPTAAKAALRDVHIARDRLADRIETPWWYRVALGLSMAFTFIAIGSGSEPVALIGGIVGCAVIPSVLMWAASRSTGVSMDRYRSAPANLYALGLFALAGLGLWLRFGLGLTWAMIPAGLLALALTLVMEPRIDVAARGNLRSDR